MSKSFGPKRAFHMFTASKRGFRKPAIHGMKGIGSIKINKGLSPSMPKLKGLK